MTSGPRIIDNDRGDITATLAGRELRGWSYETESEQRIKMMLAREFVEGWHQRGEMIETGVAA